MDPSTAIMLIFMTFGPGKTDEASPLGKAPEAEMATEDLSPPRAIPAADENSHPPRYAMTSGLRTTNKTADLPE